MELRPLTMEDMHVIRRWRHQVPETLRTPYMLTREMQEDYYRTVICDRRSATRYWAVADGDVLLGYGGIENIIWENRNGEISLLMAPNERGKGLGAEAAELILEQAFYRLNLEHVYGECYMCGPYLFWEKMVEKYAGSEVVLPRRKFWDGMYYDSYYFTFYRKHWIGCRLRRALREAKER
jgi:hypothetical protein